MDSGVFFISENTCHRQHNSFDKLFAMNKSPDYIETALVAILLLLISLKILGSLFVWNGTKKSIKKLYNSGYIGRDGVFKLVNEGDHDKARLLLYDMYGLFSLKNILIEAAVPEAVAMQLKGIIYCNDCISRVNIAATKHSKTLRRKLRQLVRYDDYGVTDSSLWDKERSYFIKTVAKVDIENDAEAKILLGPEKEYLTLAIEQSIIEIILNGWEEQDSDFNVGGALEYERWCSDILSSNGWKCRITQATGDQGADIVADKYGIKIVVQCKFYNSPVGNKAVQEVAASRAFYEADYAAVVTNSEYTNSAKSLAASNGVILVHHSELGDIWSKIYKV